MGQPHYFEGDFPCGKAYWEQLAREPVTPLGASASAQSRHHSDIDDDSLDASDQTDDGLTPLTDIIR